MEGQATAYNRATYDRIWAQMSDFIRYNPGARHRRRQVLALLAGQPFRSLLDVGCGNAELLRILEVEFPGTTFAGVDLSSEVVKANNARLPHMQFSVANIERDALPGTWDAVVCSEVLEHLDDPRAGLRTLANATAPGGCIVVTVPTGRVHATERHFGHTTHPSPDDLRAWAADAGLQVEVLLNWGFPTYAFTKWATNLRPELALKGFAGEKPYALPQIAVSTALYVANFVNLSSSSRGVQLVARLRKPA